MDTHSRTTALDDTGVEVFEEGAQGLTPFARQGIFKAWRKGFHGKVPGSIDLFQD
jgi:hypothetical protein